MAAAERAKSWDRESKKLGSRVCNVPLKSGFGDVIEERLVVCGKDGRKAQLKGDSIQRSRNGLGPTLSRGLQGKR